MSKQYHRGLSPIHDEAVDWVQKLKSGDASPKDIEAATHWRNQSPDHAAAFAAAEHVWRAVGAAGRGLEVSQEDFANTLDALGRRRRQTMNRRKFLGGGAAVIAAAGIYGTLDPPLGLWPSLSELTADYSTGTGEQRNVAFTDNVVINLNTQTSLAIRPASAVEDCVELISGEASFAASIRAARSLVVLAANGKAVTDSGRFDVRMTNGDRLPVSVTCFDGKVRIERGVDVAVLRAGERIRYGVDGLSQIVAVDPIMESEWQRGIVEFRDTPLAEAVAEINRYRPGRVVLMNGTLGQRQVNGRFRIDQMEKLLLQLEHAFDLKLRRLPGGIVLLA